VSGAAPVPRFTLALALPVLAGALLFLPSLGDGPYLDDHYQLALLEGVADLPAAGAFSLYTFSDGRRERLGGAQGDVTPWWTDPGFRLHFFRPLTCLTLHLDHALYGRAAAGFHATNLLLWALLILVASLLYRELARSSGRGPGWVLLAGVFFALDEAHVLNVSWVANRHALLGALFSVLALLAHHRFRTRGGGLSLAAALGFTALGLCSSELAVGAALWVLAYEVTLGTGSLAARARAAAPVILLALGATAGMMLAGYGASHSAWYIHPLQEPVRFAIASVRERAPMLLMGALTTVPADLSLLPAARQALWPVLMAWGLTLAFGALLWPTLRREPTARFAFLAGGLALLPQLSTWPMNRLLLLPTLGFAWTLAVAVLRAPWRRSGAAVRFRVLRLLGAGLLILIHGGVAPVQSLIFGRQYAAGAAWMASTSRSSELPGPGTGTRVLVLNGPPHALYLRAILWAEGRPRPEALWILSIAPGKQRFTRIGERRFALQADSPGLLQSVWERLVRPEDLPAEGERFRQGALEVVIGPRVDGEVRSIQGQLDLALDDPRVWLLGFDGARWRRLPAPAVGESLELYWSNP